MSHKKQRLNQTHHRQNHHCYFNHQHHHQHHHHHHHQHHHHHHHQHHHQHHHNNTTNTTNTKTTINTNTTTASNSITTATTTTATSTTSTITTATTTTTTTPGKVFDLKSFRIPSIIFCLIGAAMIALGITNLVFTSRAYYTDPTTGQATTSWYGCNPNATSIVSPNNSIRGGVFWLFVCMGLIIGIWVGGCLKRF